MGGELANSLKDLRLSRQQWIDLFQEHNILELLQEQQNLKNPGKSKSSGNLHNSVHSGPSNRTIGRLRSEKAEKETRQFRRQLKSADLMSRSLNNSLSLERRSNGQNTGYSRDMER